MVHCIEVQYITLPAAHCKSLDALLQLAAQQLARAPHSLKLYFIDSKLRATIMDSDSDLLSLKYISRDKNYKFRVEICKSKQELEDQLNS